MYRKLDYHFITTKEKYMQYNVLNTGLRITYKEKLCI